MNELWNSFHKSIEKIYHFLNSLYTPHASRWQRYGLVLILTSLFFLIKTTLSVTLQRDIPFLFSLFIVIISSWFGGFGPGILATLLSGFLTYYLFLEPKLSFSRLDDIPNIIFLIVFLLEGIFISMLSESRKRSDKHKSEFIGIVSHELKNPLTSIKGYADLIYKLAKQSKQAKQSEYALRIDAQINQVITMINDLLDVTKIETGRLTYQDDSFDILSLVKEVVSDQQVATNSHKILLSGIVKKKVHGDKYRIGQVITNLINNAIKYSPQASKIKVSIKNKAHKVIISVQDYGIGIPEEDQYNLFLPFYRAKNTQRAKGTGIGLFISSEIVKRHKGRLSMQSKLGKGSIFYLELPATT
jgi:signal transduction histidine kinase